MKKKQISPSTVILLPAFNEGRYIRHVLEKIAALNFTFVVIDDGSIDSTATIAKEFTPHVLIHRINLGKGAALKTGCEYAFSILKAEAVIFMDSDNQHNPQEVELFIKKINEGYPLVFGVRTMRKNMPKIRAFANKFASYCTQFLFGNYIPDIPSGYKAMTKQAYQQINWTASDYGVELEIAVKTAKYNISFAVVPITTIYHEMDRGMTYLDAIKTLYYLLMWRISL